ncbi:hypothetical protein FJM67_08190 [Maribrevibacterium harenarium]|uniref:Uncharacterized protein n=1 Tax=Maribrevibacterium harenarium TaxID=2589817 RepID=A0A501WRG4_9GAMM|nr:hypothetical protein [Maribrevibacterium harenarium]TPE51948.1 hypothetical protein FJM67_08190 [Maribrevibacterium harenarium]
MNIDLIRQQHFVLEHRVSEMLFYYWDPLGFNELEWARDEYDSYVPVVCEMLLDGATSSALCEYFHYVADELMGVGHEQDPASVKKAAELITYWFNENIDQITTLDKVNSDT